MDVRLSISKIVSMLFLFKYAVHAFEILQSLQLCKKKFVVAVVVSCMFTFSPKK